MDKTEQTNRLVSNPGPDAHRLDRLEEAIQQVSEQMTALGTGISGPAKRKYFVCGRPGHVAQQCSSRRPRDVKYFCCGKKGHMARNCWQQGNYQGNASIRRAGDIPKRH